MDLKELRRVNEEVRLLEGRVNRLRDLVAKSKLLLEFGKNECSSVEIRFRGMPDICSPNNALFTPEDLAPLLFNLGLEIDEEITALCKDLRIN